MRKIVATPPALNDYLHNESGFHQLIEEAAAVSALDRLWQSLVPPGLRGHSHPGRPIANSLMIVADSGMIAARLRQMLPSLQRNLAAHGLDVQLKVRISLYPPEPVAAPRPPRTMPPTARMALQQLAAQLSANDSLKQALARLLQRNADE